METRNEVMKRTIEQLFIPHKCKLKIAQSDFSTYLFVCRCGKSRLYFKSTVIRTITTPGWVFFVPGRVIWTNGD